MYVLEVIPLSRTAPPIPLSYRSSTKLLPGALISIPLRKKTVPGLVVSTSSVAESKAALKAASFSLSKSTASKKGASLPTSLIEAAQQIALYHATSLGAVLSQLLVPVLSDKLPARFPPGPGFGIERIEAPLLSRKTQYEQVLEKSETTLLIVPTLVEARLWAELLGAHKSFVLSSALTGKRRDAALEHAASVKGLIIATPGFAFIPLPHIDQIIIERMSAGSYIFPRRPYLDVRIALTELARARGITVTYGDYPLPLEYRLSPSEPLTESPQNTTSVYDARIVAGEDPTFRAVPTDIRTEIRNVLERNGRIAVLAVRKGYSPTVVCRDCGTTVTDKEGRALSLATMNDTRVFRSADGTTIQSADVLCTHCGSWNLLPLGIGIERVEEELKETFPGAPLVRIDQDQKSARSIKALQDAVLVPGTIILGTELMLPWLSPEQPIDLGVVASADSLLALPFWRARERFVRVGLMLGERTEYMFVVTRKPEDAALDALRSPTTSTFWKEETNLRQLLTYPPFGTLLVFHMEGGETQLEKMRAEIRDACLPFIPIELPPRPSLERGIKATSVLHVPRHAWPDAKLSERLAHLSPGIRLHIDSETFW